jgi:hypothetical protein
MKKAIMREVLFSAGSRLYDCVLGLKLSSVADKAWAGI